MVTKEKKPKKSSKEAEPMKLFYIFYNQERWDNWIKSLTDADFTGDSESEDMPEGYKLLFTFNQDICLSVLKIIKMYQNERFTEQETLDKINDVEQIVMGQQPEGEIAEIINSLQLSMLVLFNACRIYISNNYEKDIKTLVKKGRSIDEENMEELLETAGQIGANVIDGKSCCGRYLRANADPGLFDEWLIEIETMSEAIHSLKKFDESHGDKK